MSNIYISALKVSTVKDPDIFHYGFFRAYPEEYAKYAYSNAIQKEGNYTIDNNIIGIIKPVVLAVEFKRPESREVFERMLLSNNKFIFIVSRYNSIDDREHRDNTVKAFADIKYAEDYLHNKNDTRYMIVEVKYHL